MIKEIYLAGGCFWGIQHFVQQIRGVIETEVGYATGTGNGVTSESTCCASGPTSLWHIAKPTYEQVCSDETGFAETVRVRYDENKLRLDLLLQLFYRVIDPTTINHQGGDRGTQYRTGIYYIDESDAPVIHRVNDEVAAHYTQPLVTEILPLDCFYSAEEYHQKYLDKNPGGYCHVDPALFKIARDANAEQKK